MGPKKNKQKLESADRNLRPPHSLIAIFSYLLTDLFTYFKSITNSAHTEKTLNL